MPRGGHNAKKTEDLKASGTYRPDRHAHRLTVPPIETLPPPEDFDSEHTAAWTQLCGRLAAHGVLTALDADAVRTYVEAKITARKTYTILQQEGFMLDGRKHPLHMVYSEAVKTMRALYDQFGLTPRARMGMRIEKPAEEKPDPLTENLKMKNEGN